MVTSLKNSTKIYLNGQWVSPRDAKISIFDHGLLYGDGVFEGIRAYDGRVFRLRQHIERLFASARAITLAIPMSAEKLEETILETLRRNRLRNGYVRLIVTRGEGDLGLNPASCRKACVIVIADHIELYPRECYTKGLEAAIVSTRRNIAEAINPSIKSLNYLNNILAKIEANLRGVREAIMLNSQGCVAECTGDNVFYVKGKQLVTPPTSAGALAGITRACVMDLAHFQLGLTVKEASFTSYEIYTADECFFTGTAAEIIPVINVDDRLIGTGAPGPVTKSLIRLFRALTQTEGTPIDALRKSGLRTGPIKV
jgi:branched-chain amino acid aminotransferase